MVYTNENTINVKKNSKYLSEGDDFCCDTCHSVTFDFDTNMSYIVDPHGSTIPKGVLHINDINIDGYPDILMIINN